MSVDRQNFWARRRAAVAAEERAEFEKRGLEERAKEQAALEEKSDDEILTELDLPTPEDLKPGDDFSGFMTKAVPDRIRRRALRVLWRSNPVLANIDELVEYGEDYTDGAMVVENLQTAYQVGKGMLAHLEKLAAEEDTETALVESPTEEFPEAVEPAAAEAAYEVTVEAAPDEVADVPPAPRRMTFTYETDPA